MRKLIPLVFVFLFWACGSAQAVDVDVTAKAKLNQVRVTYDLKAKTTNYTLSLTNLNLSKLQSPVTLVLENITSTKVTLLNANSQVGGLPAITFPLGKNPLGYNETSQSKVIKFSNPSRVRFAYKFKVMGSYAPLSIAGEDVDGNGVWDYVDQYIDSKFTTSSQFKTALQNYAKTFQKSLLEADSLEASLHNETELLNSMFCAFDLIEDKESQIFLEIEPVIVNTPERLKAYLKYDAKIAGHTTTASKTPCQAVSQSGGL